MEMQTAEKIKEIVISRENVKRQLQEVVLSVDCTTDVVVDKDVEVHVIIKGIGDLRMHMREGADVSVTCMVPHDDVSPDMNREVVVGRTSRLNWNDVCFGDGELKVRTAITLAEEGAHAVHSCVYIGGDSSRKDFHTIIRHTASHTTSRMHVRGVLGGAARAAYKGVTVIDARTSGCDADQRHKTLLLDDTAEVRSDPVLEVHAENVTCGHGASITRVDDEKIFFLKTRGIKTEEANKMIVHGFIQTFVGGLDEEDTFALHEYTDRLV